MRSSRGCKYRRGVGNGASADDIREAARLARTCAVVGGAVKLANWISSGRRQVTAGKVLRKADFDAAGALLGVEVPPRTRAMSDIRGLNRPWRVAVATGLLSVEKGWAHAGPSRGSWPPEDDADLLDWWLTGLREVCATESRPQAADSVELLVLALLTVLESGGTGKTLSDRIHDYLRSLGDLLDRDTWRTWHAADQYYDLEAGRPFAGLIEMLAEFGAVKGSARAPKITVLGRWTLHRLRDELAFPAPIELTAADLIAEASRYADWDERERVSREWLEVRDPAEAAEELLRAGEDARPFGRTVAVGLAGTLAGASYPVWQEAADWPRTGPHAREVLAFRFDEESSESDLRWLVAEYAAAALEETGPDRALTWIWTGLPEDSLSGKLASVAATGHPDAAELVRAVEEFLASGAPRSIDQAAVVKVTLEGFRPPLWRRIQIPVVETLDTLHQAIQILFGWDGDHLHVFEVGAKRYGADDMSLEDVADAVDCTLKEAFEAGDGVIRYTYDFGSTWLHEITLEKMIKREPDATYPVCVAFKGDQPIEYWSGDESEEPEPFDQDAVNRALARLAMSSHQDGGNIES